MPKKTEVAKGSSQHALTVLQANGLSFAQAMELQNLAHEKKDERVPKYGAWMISHSDGTYSAGSR